MSSLSWFWSAGVVPEPTLSGPGEQGFDEAICRIAQDTHHTSDIVAEPASSQLKGPDQFVVARNPDSHDAHPHARSNALALRPSDSDLPALRRPRAVLTRWAYPDHSKPTGTPHASQTVRGVLRAHRSDHASDAVHDRRDAQETS